MSAPVRKRGFLLNLAAEGMAPAVAGCAAPAAGEKAIDRFGLHIVSRWFDWLNDQPLPLRRTAIGELADLPAAKARVEAIAAIDSFSPISSAEDRGQAVEYLCALPRFAQRALVLDHATGGFTLPEGIAADNFLSLLGLLPIDVPPYPAGSLLPDTDFLLGDLAGGGSLGTFYRASSDSLGSPVLVKCCTDPPLIALLRRHATRLKPPVSAKRWSNRLVRLLAAEFDHPTPFLVWEHAGGGDLAMLLANLKHQTGRGFAPDEVLRLIEQIVEGLAFAHALGMVHGDLKPANVLVSGEALKLADLGAGIATAAHALTHSHIGEKPLEHLRPSEQVTLLRGAGSLLYLSPEQRRDEEPDPRHDLFGLGVLWFQLLIGDVTRGPRAGWQLELEEKHRVPVEQISLIERCVTRIEDRPRDAGALIVLMRPQAGHSEIKLHAESVVSPEEVRRERLRKQALLRGLQELRWDLAEYREKLAKVTGFSTDDIWFLLYLPIPLGLLLYLTENGWLSLGLWLMLIGFQFWANRQYRRARAKALLVPINHRVERLAQEHPDEVQSWGGIQSLLEPALLAEIIAAFEEDMRTLSPDLELFDEQR